MNKGFYTLEKNGSVIVATSVDTDQTFEIKADHNKFSKIEDYLNDGKLLSVTAKGTWSGRKDYEGFYNQPAKADKPVEVKLTKLNDLNFSDDLFVPMKTGTPMDSIISTDGGFMPGSNLMIAGSAGIGKCVRGNTLIKIRNKKTGQVAQMTIKEFHELAR